MLAVDFEFFNDGDLPAVANLRLTKRWGGGFPPFPIDLAPPSMLKNERCSDWKTFGKNIGKAILASVSLATSVSQCDGNPALDEVPFSVVKTHNTSESLWVIYANVIYDVTEFLSAHPGGSDKLLLAGGGHLEPFWNFYKQHLKNSYVIEG